MGEPSPSPDESGVVAIGSMLDGRYRVDAVLGAGGMGRVYKAEHTGIGRAVAIKVLHARLGGSSEAAKRFQREAMASGRLDHPNIVGVSDFGTLDDGSLYLVMEALEGESLGKRLERDRRIPWPEALLIIRSVLAGLRHAHDKGVVHRDIKPDNIFLAKKDGETVVKILDFGIAKLYAGNADDPASTRAGLTVGTPAYLSPEQAVGGTISPASDLYSTSIVLYEMLAGRAPFIDEEPLTMLTSHVSKDPPPFAEVAPDLELPPGIEAVVQRGLAKISAERIGNALDYMQQLDDALRAAGVDPLVAVPRASSQLSIASGPYSIPTPPPGYLMTPMPQRYGEMGSAPTQSLDGLPMQSRPVSLVDVSEPLPKKLKMAAVAIVAVAVIGALYFLLFHSNDPKKGGKQGVVTVQVPVVDKETRLKAALHDLENGKTCADRKAAIPTLVEIGDERAIAALKKARHRMRGGVLGVGDSNTNACLKSDAETAVQALGGTLK
jgi:serine/threonine-protein kinase